MREKPVVGQRDGSPRGIVGGRRSCVADHEFALREDVHLRIVRIRAATLRLQDGREHESRDRRKSHPMSPSRFASNTASVFECTASLR